MTDAEAEGKVTGEWSLEEHQQYIRGLHEVGPGKWVEIARDYVPSRTSTQVASHNQKFINKLDRPLKKRRNKRVNV